MRFSVYQVSRKGGREKNEDRMGYCYTRDAGLFALADGMGGHPEGEVASQLALQTLAALFQRDAKPTLADPTALPDTTPIIAGHHQLLRYATAEGAARHAAHHAWWPACCRATRRTGRIAATRGCTSCAATSSSRAPATIRTPSCRRR